MAITLPAGITRETAVKLLVDQGMSTDLAAQLVSKPGGIATATQYTGLQEALKTYTPPAGYRTTTEKAPISFGGISPRTMEITGKLEGAATEEKPPTTITLRLSDTELQKLATLREQACPGGERQYEPRIFKATLTTGGHIFVEATTNAEAKTRAKEAGYSVAWVTWSPKYEQKPKTTTAVSGATIRIKDGKTGETLEFPQEGWNAWPDKYKTITKKDGYDSAMREFKGDYYQLADGQWLLRSDFYALPTHYADIAATQGYDAMQKAFEAENTKLGDGQWIPTKDWNVLVQNDEATGTNFADIGKTKGYDAMVAAIDEANKPYEEFLQKVERGDIIKVAGDQYITKEEFNKLPSGFQQILQQQGFPALEDIGARKWENIRDPSKSLTNDQFKRLCNEYEAKREALIAQGKDWFSITQEIGHNPANEYALDAKSTQRALIGIASMIAPPARAALPEYTMKDITALDWGITAANTALLALGFAPGAIVGSAIGKAVTIGASGAMSGMIGYETAKNWENLTSAQRGMGVGMAALCAVPIITTVARNVKISGPAIPTTGGKAVPWKGLSVAGTPIIGKSGGKWVVGTRGITLPEARMILNGYKPETMLETKVFVNRPALGRAGFTTTQIDYLADTLKARNLFAGKMSPWLDKDVLLEPTQRLNATEIDLMATRLNKLEQAKPGSVDHAYLLYGSPTIKAQAAPELRGWRPMHDWDISLNMNQAETEAFTQSFLNELKSKGGGIYRINPEKPTLIEKKINGTFDGNHIFDIHSQEEVAVSASNLPSSKLDATGDYSYGRMVSEPAITVKYPGVGELRIMRLSESGVRKADTILRVRQTGEGTAFKPPERGIAQPGVPKDAADFYVTLRTFQGEQIAEEWLESWAKAMGYNKAQLAKVLPKIRQSMLEVAAQTPSDILGYEFRPSGTARVSPGASPSIVVHIPSSLGASVSPSLGSRISEPIYPYKAAKSPEMQAALSAAVSTLVSKAPSKALASAKISPSVARSLASKASPKPSPSPAVSKVPSPSAKPSASTVPSVYPSGHPAPSGKPSKVPSPTPSPKPSPVPSPTPTPSPKPSPYPYPYPKPRPKPKPFPKVSVTKAERKPIHEGPALATWKQGLYWVSIFPPFRTHGTKPDVVYSRTRPHYASLIAKGRRAPMKTLRAMGKIPALIELPMGVTTARIRHGRELVFSRSGTNGRKRTRR